MSTVNKETEKPSFFENLSLHRTCLGIYILPERYDQRIVLLILENDAILESDAYLVECAGCAKDSPDKCREI